MADTNPINDIQQEIIDEFALFDDWSEKYGYIVEMGKKLDPLEEKYKTDQNIIKGCQSRVWLQPDFTNDGRVIFMTDSDAIIVKGLIYMLVRVMSHQKPKDIVNAELYFIDEIGMSQHLSQTRSNGLAAMVKQMKLYGLVYLKKQEADAE